MSLSLKVYDQYFFDCDGVILNSNHIKSDAFYNVAFHFSQNLAAEFLDFHKANGGISRFAKFEHFFSKMMGLPDYKIQLALALDMFQTECVSNLKTCEVIPGIDHFLNSLPKSASKYVVSGGLQDEVRMALREKGLDKFFTEIFGSPATKFEIMEKVRKDGAAIFFGDAKLDYEVSQHFHCDFVFVSEKSEFKDYKNYFAQKDLLIIPDFTSLF